MKNKARKLIMIMVDGFGVPPEGWEKSIFAKYCSPEFIKLFIENSIPLNATLDIEGIPQSATGQTTLFTGVNAAKIVGSHISGFPGPSLKAILKSNNIFLALIKLGKQVVFANSYSRYPLNKILGTRFASVTSVMLSTFAEKALDTDDLLKGEAVFHDITRRTITEKYGIPVTTPEDGAKHLLKVSSKNDFTLFEYFMTDRAGHANEEKELKTSLDELSRFILELCNNLPEGTGLLLCSDHGNCEDTNTKQHTFNPTPLLMINMDKPNTIPKCLTDVYNLIINYFENKS